MHAFGATAHFGVIGALGERQSRRYAELFIVALMGLAGATLASQARSHEIQDLKHGRRSANHAGKLSFFTEVIKITCFEKVYAVVARNIFW